MSKPQKSSSGQTAKAQQEQQASEAYRELLWLHRAFSKNMPQSQLKLQAGISDFFNTEGLDRMQEVLSTMLADCVDCNLNPKSGSGKVQFAVEQTSDFVLHIGRLSTLLAQLYQSYRDCKEQDDLNRIFAAVKQLMKAQKTTK